MLFLNLRRIGPISYTFSSIIYFVIWGIIKRINIYQSLLFMKVKEKPWIYSYFILLYMIHVPRGINMQHYLHTQHTVFLSPCGLVNPPYVYSMCTRDNNDLLFHSLWSPYKFTFYFSSFVSISFLNRFCK